MSHQVILAGAGLAAITATFGAVVVSRTPERLARTGADFALWGRP